MFFVSRKLFKLKNIVESLGEYFSDTRRGTKHFTNVAKNLE